MSVVEEQSSRWRAAASPGGLIGLVLTILCFMAVVASVLGITGTAGLPFSDGILWIIFALSLLASLLFAFLLWGYLSIGYQLDASRLRINWGLWSDQIPLSEIESIAPAVEVLGPKSPGWQPFWPGYYVGRHRSETGEIQVIATLPPRRQVLITAADGRRFAISPERPLLFMEEFARCFNAVTTAESAAVPESEPDFAAPAQRFVDAGWTTEYSTLNVTPRKREEQAVEQAGAIRSPHTEPAVPEVRVYRAPPSSTSPLLRPILLSDPVALVFIIVGILATAAMAIYILVQYQDIPPSLTLHWNVDGLPGRVGEPQEIWILPTIAGLVLMANIGLAWSIALFDRFAARLMLGSTVIVHLVTWIALLMLLQ